MSYKIPGLVAESISQKLFDKILSKTLKPITQNQTFYIKQDTGDDATANGSQSKPFKSLIACMNYIQKNIITNNSIEIHFLSDYDEAVDSISMRNLNILAYITLVGTNYNVILNNFSVYQAYIHFKDITFRSRSADQIGIYVSENSFVIVTNCSHIDTVENAGENIFVNRGGFVWFKNGGNFTVNKSNRSIIRAETTSAFYKDDDSVLTINGNAYSLFNVKGSSNVIFINGSFTGSFVGKKFNLERNSCLNLFSRGDSHLLGTAGTKDETSIIC